MDPLDLRDRFLALLENQLAGWDAPLLPPVARARSLAAWLDLHLSRCEDELFARGFARACPVPGLEPQDYLHRVLEGRPTLLAGIRFRGGDLGWPFVDLLAWDAELAGDRAWRQVRHRLAEAFAPFAPRAVRVRLPADLRPPHPHTVDQFLVGERLATLRARPRPWGFVAVDVRPSRDLDWLPQLTEAHLHWQARAGPLRGEVAVASAEELQDCLDTGAVCCAWTGDRWAGVVAARRARERALDGYEVVELFLGEALRGQRRAAVLQRHLIEALANHGRDCLFGTIAASNRPSLRTAQQVGRVLVERWVFLPL